MIVVGSPAATEQLPALFDPQPHVTIDLLPMRAVDERADGGGVVLRITDTHFGDNLDEPLAELSKDLALDQQARAGEADFAVVCEDRLDRAGDSSIEVAVREHDVGRLAAQFH